MAGLESADELEARYKVEKQVVSDNVYHSWLEFPTLRGSNDRSGTAITLEKRFLVHNSSLASAFFRLTTMFS